MTKSIRVSFILMVLGLMAFSVSELSAQEEEGELTFYPRGSPDRGRQAFIRLQCTQCHQVMADPDLPQPEEPQFAPVLSRLNAPRSAERLAAAIESPLHEAIPEYSPITEMPEFKESLTTRDLIDIVTYLRSVQED